MNFIKPEDDVLTMLGDGSDLWSSADSNGFNWSPEDFDNDFWQSLDLQLSYSDNSIDASPQSFTHETYAQNTLPDSRREMVADSRETKISRRRAQNRAAQRAYRGRKDKELQSAYERITELEKKIEETFGLDTAIQKTSNISQKLQAAEAKNESLNQEVQRLQSQLQLARLRVLYGHSATR